MIFVSRGEQTLKLWLRKRKNSKLMRCFDGRNKTTMSKEMKLLQFSYF